MTYEEAIAVFMITEYAGLTYKQFQAMTMLIDAAKLQVAKKPIYSDFGDNGFDEIIPYRAECPTCGNSFEFGTWNDEENHHCECGQKLDWSKE